MKNLTIIIPTYNEAENIEAISDAILRLGLPDLSILFIDDNSPDGTGPLADKLAGRHPGRISVLHREGKLGLGTAYITGFKHALENGAAFVGQMDADFSHDPAVIPEFLRNHVLLEKRQPPSEVHSIHLVQRIQGKILDFYHMFRIHLQFGGDTSAIVRQGTSDLYPSFITNRVYYTSRLVPGKKAGDSGSKLDSLKLKDRLDTESDQHFHTFAIFDDVETGSLTRQLLAGVPDDIFQVSTSLYPFVVFDYFTACMNILSPTQAAIQQAVDIFEPLFFVVAGGFVPPATLAPGHDLAEMFSGRLALEEDRVSVTPEFTAQLRDYFSGVGIERDDELAVKGWWRFVFEG